MGVAIYTAGEIKALLLRLPQDQLAEALCATPAFDMALQRHIPQLLSKLLAEKFSVEPAKKELPDAWLLLKDALPHMEKLGYYSTGQLRWAIAEGLLRIKQAGRIGNDFEVIDSRSPSSQLARYKINPAKCEQRLLVLPEKRSNVGRKIS